MRDEALAAEKAFGESSKSRQGCLEPYCSAWHFAVLRRRTDVDYLKAENPDRDPGTPMPRRTVVSI